MRERVHQIRLALRGEGRGLVPASEDLPGIRAIDPDDVEIGASPESPPCRLHNRPPPASVTSGTPPTEGGGGLPPASSPPPQPTPTRAGGTTQLTAHVPS